MILTSLLLTALSANIIFAHPGEEHHHDHVKELTRRDFVASARRSLEGCQAQLQAPNGVLERAIVRRAATVAKHRRRLLARDTDEVLNKTHLSTSGYTLDTPDTTVFATNNTCALSPEGETGPYWVKGELIRDDVRDGEPGVPIVIEAQFLDIETCEPIEGIYWDMWSCNSTGVYSGVIANGNGDTSDTANLNRTFMRGLTKSNSDGVAQFESVFPGHYSGRATHHHMAAHLNATILANNTLTGGTVAHVGQLFWDQDIISKVEATYPYNTNNVTLTTNAEDRIFQTETTNTTTDPVFEYVYLGDNLSDGLFGWVTVAVNMSATYDPAYSFEFTANGSIASSGGEDTANGGPGGGGGNGTMPSGTPPS